MFTDDWIKREIEGLSKAIARGVFHLEVDTVEPIDENGFVCESDLLNNILYNKVHNGDIIEAEQLMLERVNADPSPENLTLALNFYNDLTDFDEEFLVKNGYSSDRKAEGIATIKSIYNGD